MPRYLILGQSQVTANALNVWLNLLGEQELNDKDSRRIVWDREGVPAIDAYETLVQQIESAAKGKDLTMPVNEVIVLVDSVRPSELNAVSEGGGWNNLLAMLILSFPEICWHFGVFAGPRGEYESSREAIPDTILFPDLSHSLSALLPRIQRDPLLDPTGLRQWVRRKTADVIQRIGNDVTPPVRLLRAAAIDDERDYARYHGYTAYRFGCRVDAVTKWSLMQKLFSFSQSKKSHGYWLLLEDMSLNFSDRPANIHLLQLKTYRDEQDKEQGRTKHCPQLDSYDPSVETSAHRVIVTTGPTQTDKYVINDNKAYLRDKAEGDGAIIFKPAGGMFDLWKEARLLKRREGSQRHGNVAGFGWPLPPTDVNSPKKAGHGSPGKLLLIAETLICRAEGMMKDTRSVSQAIQGAVLATDALELTGGRTPTTALQALRIKHEFEVLAECQFSGVEYHLTTEPRIREINLEVRAICLNFHEKQREYAALNAKMHVLSRLIQIFRQYGQFDEELLCMNRVRHLQNSLWMRQKPGRYLVWPFLRYTEFLIGSFGVFVIMIAGWIVLLTSLYWLSFHTGVDPPNHIPSLIDAAEAAITSFFSIGDPIYNSDELKWSDPGFYYAVISIAVVSGFVHLGIFVSHLYAMLSRK